MNIESQEKIITLRIINRILNESVVPAEEIRVFDFDDTLVKTGSMIHVTGPGGEKFSMTPRDYAMYVPSKHDKFDFSDFEDLIDPQPVQSTLLKLKMAIRDVGQDNVFILTARGNPDPVREFLRSQEIPDIQIFAVGSSDPQKKADVIKNEVLSRKKLSRRVKNVFFYDDSPKNIRAVRALKRDKELFGVDIVTIKV